MDKNALTYTSLPGSRLSEIVTYTDIAAVERALDKLIDSFGTLINWIHANKNQDAKNFVLRNLLVSALPYLKTAREQHSGLVQLLAFSARNLYELHIRVDYVLKNTDCLNQWLNETAKDCLDIYEACLIVDPNDSASQRDRLEKAVIQIKENYKSKGKDIPKLLHLGNVAADIGKESEHKSMHKIFSKFLHPTSFLVNSKWNDIQSNAHRNMFIMHTQLYAWSVHDSIVAAYAKQPERESKMDKKSMDEQVNKELEELYPRNERNLEKNIEKSAFNAARRQDLSKNPLCPIEETLEKVKKAVNAT